MSLHKTWGECKFKYNCGVNNFPAIFALLEKLEAKTWPAESNEKKVISFPSRYVRSKLSSYHNACIKMIKHMQTTHPRIHLLLFP